MRCRAALVFLLLACGGCGGRGDGRAVFAHAQEGLGRIRAGTVVVHATVHALAPLERSGEVPARELPLSRLRLTRWIRHPRRVGCTSGLECARADLDVEAALRDLDPLLPSLPVDPRAIRSARVEVAVAKRDHLPRRLRLHGELEPGGLVPESVPFDLELDLARAHP